jgi:hypothetical protein
VFQSFARDDNKLDEVQRLHTWFSNFENALRELFSEPSLRLEFDRESFNFLVNQDNRETYSLYDLPDGFSAILDIVSELILRMYSAGASSNDINGIVLIDEIKTHLHVKLQKKVLPFLTNFFPKVQFIVSTHSPFVLQSVSNSVIYDLENNVKMEDFTNYSYDAILESYFDVDKYSKELKEKIERYELLISSRNLKPEDRYEKNRLKEYFQRAPDFGSEELRTKLLRLKKSIQSDQ